MDLDGQISNTMDFFWIGIHGPVEYGLWIVFGY